ncbi:avirulence protein [Paraburkholderia madseniana]|uniref:Avirulence protein n=1 Tax=Paraburkholderia madseniana TaxID=2599607 RepID=A0A6N6WEC7_9BURK|nr:YopJ family acetyltransferase [Paraburkholderia madseniana]KAE8758451.1 avirulence protein [Paraburkholderia madseniana]
MERFFSSIGSPFRGSQPDEIEYGGGRHDAGASPITQRPVAFAEESPGRQVTASGVRNLLRRFRHGRRAGDPARTDTSAQVAETSPRLQRSLALDPHRTDELGRFVGQTQRLRSPIAESSSAQARSNYIESQQDDPPKVPGRLREKIKTVDSKLKQIKRANTEFYEYAKLSVGQTSEGSKPDWRTNQFDKKYLPLIAEMENQRNPGLNLHVFDKADECHEYIKQMAGARGTGNFRVVYPPFAGSRDHYVALDVRLRGERRPSIVVYESALAQTLSMFPAMFAPAKVKVVFNGIQNSEWDCVMFALNNALKSFKTHAEYADLLHRGGEVNSVPMPAVFRKHMHSRSALNHMPQADEIVTKAQTGPDAETLRERVNAYRTNRFGSQYSTSIEGFRLQEIRRVGEYLRSRKR